MGSAGPHWAQRCSGGLCTPRWPGQHRWCRRWEEGRVLWLCAYLSVLLLQWRRAAFPGQVSDIVSLGTALGLGTGAGGAWFSPACINNQGNGVCGWEIPSAGGFGPGFGLPGSRNHLSMEECVWPVFCWAVFPLPTLPGHICWWDPKDPAQAAARCSRTSGATQRGCLVPGPLPRAGCPQNTKAASSPVLL